MIVVENINGDLRLVCKERHEFGLLQPDTTTDPASFFNVIEAGTVGGYVPYLKEGTQVDFWINDRVWLDKFVLLTQSIIHAESFVRITQYTSIGQSFLHIKNQLSLTNSDERIVQMLDCRISCNVLLVSASVVTHTRIESETVSFVASEVSHVHSKRSIDFSLAKVVHSSFDYDKEEALSKEGPINPALYDTILQPTVQCTASQLTSVTVKKDVYLVTMAQCTLMDCEIDCSVMLLDVVARESQFQGIGMRMLNSWLRKSSVESLESGVTLLNAVLYDDQIKIEGLVVFPARQTINGRYEHFLYASEDT